MDIDSNKIELNVKNNMAVYDYKKLIEKNEKEIELINNKIDKMYMDKLDNKISEEMYQRILKKYKDEIQTKEQENIKIKEHQKELEEDNSENIKKVIKEFLGLKEPTLELMRVIINKIKLHQDKQIDIIFNFKEPE